MMKKLLVALVMAVAVPVGMTAVTGFAFVPEAQAWSIKGAAKKVGRGIKKGGKAVGRAAKKSGKAVGRGGKSVGRFAKDVGRGGKIVGKKVGKKVGRAGKWVGRGAKGLGKGAWNGAKCIAKGGCATIGPRPGPGRRDHRS